MKCSARILSILMASLLLIASGGAPRASASPCDCPAKDPLAKEGCGVKPAGMPSADPFSDFSCRLDHGLSGSLREVFKPLFVNQASNFSTHFESKSKLELLNYISCYRGNDERFCHFKKSLAPYLSYATEITRFPLSIQTCLLLKESSFNPKAKSEDGATGYAQLMPDTIKDVDKCLRRTGTEWNEVVALSKKSFDEAKDLKKPEDVKSMILKRKETTLYRDKACRRVREIWDRYWAGTKENPCSYGTRSVSKEKSSCLKKEMATCYRYAPILSMMKQALDANHIMIEFLDENYDKNSKNDDDSLREVQKSGRGYQINGMSEMDSALFLTGAYNRGTNGFLKRCATKTDMKSCIDQFSTSSETRKHLQGIRNCAQKHSLEPTQDPYDPKAKRKNCDKWKCIE